MPYNTLRNFNFTSINTFSFPILLSTVCINFKKKLHINLVQYLKDRLKVYFPNNIVVKKSTCQEILPLSHISSPSNSW